MQTAIRVTEQLEFSSQGYKMMYIQILAKQEYSDSLEPIGEITFQTDRGRDNEQNKWYGFTYVVSSDRAYKLIAMAKLAKFIEENVYSGSVTPEELIAVIGGVKHVIIHGRYIPENWVGVMNAYKLLRGGVHYKTFFAPNTIVAEKEFQKICKGKNWQDASWSHMHLVTKDTVH